MSVAQDEGQHEFLLLPSIDGFDSFDESDPLVKHSDQRISADMLYSYSGKHFRFLGEYLWSSSESELERLKVGWAVADHATLWFGRFHTPSRFWTSEYHHGQYLQTSITRPSLEAWEDINGSTPTHITGVLFESEKFLQDDASFEYALSAGLAPKFADQELAPFDILDPRSGHGLSLNARIGYRPKFYGPMSVGFLWSWNRINAVAPAAPGPDDLDRIDQLTAGVFLDWRWQDLRLITSAVYYHNELRYFGETVNDEFGLAYAQPEYELTENLTLFGRVDAGIGEDDSTYLRELPAFVSHRNMAGIRWDFADFQALTLEIADASRQGADDSHSHFKEFRLQWSAVFP